MVFLQIIFKFGHRGHVIENLNTCPGISCCSGRGASLAVPPVPGRNTFHSIQKSLSPWLLYQVPGWITLHLLNTHTLIFEGSWNMCMSWGSTKEKEYTGLLPEAKKHFCVPEFSFLLWKANSPKQEEDMIIILIKIKGISYYCHYFRDSS